MTNLKTAFSFMIIIGLAMLAVAGNLEIYKGHVNGPVKGFTETDPALFAADPVDSRYYMEIWFHEMQFRKEEIIVNINFQMNNLGPSRGYCDMFIMVSDRSSGLLLDKATFSHKDVTIAEKGFSIQVGPNSMKLDGNVYRLKAAGKTMSADFTFIPQAGSFIQGDGTVRFAQGEESARHSLPIPWAKVKGTLKYNNKTLSLDGYGSVNHEWQVLSPSNYMTSLRLFYLYSDNGAINIASTTSKSLEGRWVQRLAVAKKGSVVFSSHDYELEGMDVKPVPGAKIPCPRRFRVSAIHGDDRLEGEIEVLNFQEKKEILEDYNFMFRKLAAMVIGETWSYRFWVNFRFNLKLGSQTTIMEGKGTGNFIESIGNK